MTPSTCPIRMKSSFLESSHRALQVTPNRRIQGRRSLLDGARPAARGTMLRRLLKPSLRGEVTTAAAEEEEDTRRWREQYTSRSAAASRKTNAVRLAAHGHRGGGGSNTRRLMHRVQRDSELVLRRALANTASTMSASTTKAARRGLSSRPRQGSPAGPPEAFDDVNVTQLEVHEHDNDEPNLVVAFG